MKKLLSSTKFQIGFTLIELLVAVAIIVILISIGAISYTTVNRNVRNSQRQSDLQKIATALEEYYVDHGTYPNTDLGGQFKTLSAYPALDVGDCLLGLPLASNPYYIVTAADPGPPPVAAVTAPSCTAPFNVYIGNGDVAKIPFDPNYRSVVGNANASYAYGSNGQSYVLTTRYYEGTPPADHAFTCSFNSYYRHEAQKWSGFTWDNQYAIISPHDTPVNTGSCP